MAQNLNIGTMVPGNIEQTNHTSIEKYCYNNDEANCTVYGGLYQWDNMMQWSASPGAKGICPTDWHLPTDGEWTLLTTFLGGESVAGGKMKEVGTAHWASPNLGATNESGFTALPIGYRNSVGNFYDLTANAFFWTSSQFDATNAWYRYLGYNYEGVYRISSGDKTTGFSTRCIHD
ncbi:MAG: FISUMP domain-containing protein [Bacteroidota bacterium]